jgi:putative ABC transport system substrate-binding protein
MPITRTILVALASSLLMVSVNSDAQQAQTIPTIGVLSNSSPGSAFCIEPFKAGLHDLGYVEGRTIRFAYRYAEGKPEPLPALAAELAHLTPDILFTWTAVGVCWRPSRRPPPSPL